ncbi:MAG: T9SS type A sorting domain-containing protein [Chlorobi bacterium]|nr:T9SS type A sorting domain-containing protein [Chlorobiota bacterium]
MRLLFFYITLFLVFNNAFSQSIESSLVLPSTIGTDYFTAFLPNDNASASRFMGLYLTSEKNTVCTIEIPNQPSKTVKLEAGKTSIINIDLTLEQKVSEVPIYGSIHITSRIPISVFTLNSRNKSSAGFAVIPINFWGTSYLSVTLPNADNDKVCQFLIIASEDSTQVTVIPSANTTKYSANQKVNFKLNKGQTYLVRARQGELGVRDLTSSVIKSNKPIGLICGHTRTPITVDAKYQTGLFSSHQSFMMLPDSLWGKEYIAIPSRSEGDRFRVVASKDSTRLIVKNLRPFLPADIDTFKMDRGDVLDLSQINFLRLNNTTIWSSNNPVFISQLRVSGGDFPVADNAPSMIPLVPISSYSSNTIFSAPIDINSDNFKTHKVVIIAKGDKLKAISDSSNPLNKITLDGVKLIEKFSSINFNQINKSDWYWDTINISSGSHIMVSSPEFPICTELIGGNAVGDFYRWTNPTWITQIEPDTKAPVFLGVIENKVKGTLKVKISDKSQSYSSGINEINLFNSPGWKIVDDGISGNLNDDAEPIFKAISDPSGELLISISDNDGNSNNVKIYDNICFKTALIRDTIIRISIEQNKSTSIFKELTTNICNDSSKIKLIDLTSGDAIKHLKVEFVNYKVPFILNPNLKAGIKITASPDIYTLPGLYKALLRVMADDSTLLIPIELEVKNIGTVDFVSTNKIALISPNPFRNYLIISINDKSISSVTIMNILGQEIYSFPIENLIQRSLIWDCKDIHGNLQPAGTYFIRFSKVNKKYLSKIVLID